MDVRTELMSIDGDHRSRETKRRILEGIAITITTVTVWFNESY